LPSRVSYGTRDPFIEAGHDVISQLRPWKATIAAWLAVVALVAAPSVVRAHGPSAPRASDLSAVVAAPAVHVSAPRRVEIDSRAPRHSISILPAALPAGRVVAVEPVVRAQFASPRADHAADATVASGYDATAPPRR
jgi:hypothetical protein